MKTIDTKVVEMRFDNKSFESEAKTTMNTLEKLKEKLQFSDAGKGLEQLDKAAKNVTLEGIAAGVEMLTKRFSTFGIVSTQIITNLTNSIMGKLHSALNYVSDSIVSGGVRRAMNIENAHFQLQALLKDEVKVQAVMADAMTSVDGTAYAYDEAAKAASQFAASGIQAGEQMLGALKGITGVAAMTNSDFESISRIFTTVAGNGRLMGDQLLQLSSRGLNAASTLADYFKEVRGQADMTEASIREMVSKGELDFDTFAAAMNWAFGESAARANETFTGSMSNMKSALARIGAEFVSPLVEQNSELVKMFNALRLKINEIKGVLTFNEQKSAISGLTEVTSYTADEMDYLFGVVKSGGASVADLLYDLQTHGEGATADLSQSLLKYVNGVVNGTVRATYATTNAINTMTDSQEISMEKLQELLKAGKIDLAMFTSAMETEYGNVRALSKQVTDFILDSVKALTNWVNNLDLSKPFMIYEHVLESIKNVLKGLMSVLAPVGQAFKDVFLSFDLDILVSFSKNMEDATSKMRLSESRSNKLYDALKGVFSIIKTLIDWLGKLVKAFKPVLDPMIKMGGAAMDVSGSIGELLSKLSDWSKESKTMTALYNAFAGSIEWVSTNVSKLIDAVKKAVKQFNELKIVKDIKGWFVDTFGSIDEVLGKFIDFMSETFGAFMDDAVAFIEENLPILISSIGEGINSIKEFAQGLDLSSLTNTITSFANAIKQFFDTVAQNPGVDSFIKGAKEFGKNVLEAFSLDHILDNFKNNWKGISDFFTGAANSIDYEGIQLAFAKVKLAFTDFGTWFNLNVMPFFSDLTAGGVMSAAGGFGMIGSIMHLTSTIENVANKFVTLPQLLKSVKGVLDSLKSTLVAYQAEIKTKALINIAKAIAILCGSLVLLTFADTTKLLDACGVLVMVAGAVAGVMYAWEKLNQSKVNKNMTDSPLTLAKAIKKLGKSLGNAAKWWAIGKAFVKLAEAVILIAVAIVGLGLFYTNNKAAFEAGAIAAGAIMAALVAIMALMVFLNGKDNNMKKVDKGANAVLKLSASLNLVIAAIDKLQKIQFAEDWGLRLTILAGIFVALGLLAIAFGESANLSGKKKFNSSSLLAACAGVYLIVLSLEKLMSLDFEGPAWGNAMASLVIIFIALAGVIAALGFASGKAGKGGIKSAGTLIALAASLFIIVLALGFLIEYPLGEMVLGAGVLAILLLAVAAALSGAGKASDPAASKTVYAMAVMVGVIVAALGLLSMIDLADLAKAAVVLGSMLFILAKDLSAAGKANDKGSMNEIIAMCAAIAVITVSLGYLSKQPWPNLIAGAVALGVVLGSLAGAMYVINKDAPSWNKQLAATLVEIVVLLGSAAVAMWFLSDPSRSWENMLAGAAGMAAIFLSLAYSMKIMNENKLKWKREVLTVVLEAIVLLAAVAAALWFLGDPSRSWENMLAGAVSMSVLLLALAEVIKILAEVGKNNTILDAIKGVGMLDILIADLLLVVGAIGALDNALGGGVSSSIEAGLDIIVVIVKKIGEAIAGLITGALEELGPSLKQFGYDLTIFTNNLNRGFIPTMKEISEMNLGYAVGSLTEGILHLAQANFVNGIATIIGQDLPSFAEELGNFMDNMGPFVDGLQAFTATDAQKALWVSQTALNIANAQVAEGLNQFLPHKSNMKDFGEELAAFGDAIAGFIPKVAGIGEEQAKTAKAVAETMYELSTGIDGYNDLYTWLNGGKGDMGTFASDLALFGMAIKGFVTRTTGINEESVAGAKAAADVLVELNESLPEQGGFIATLFGGTMDLDQFGQKLEKLANSLVVFCEKLDRDEFKQSVVNKAVDSLEKLIDLAEYAKEVDGQPLVQFTKDLKGAAISAVADFIAAFEAGTEQVGIAISDFVTAAQNGVVEGGKQLNTSGQEAGKQTTDGVLKGIQLGTPAVTATGKSMATGVKTEVGNVLTARNFQGFGKNAGDGINQGLTDSKAPLTRKASEVTYSITEVVAAAMHSKNYKPYGENVGSGIGTGLTDSGQKSAIGNVKNFASAVKWQMDEEFKSTKFQNIGGNIAQGLIDGMNVRKRDVVNAGYGLGSASAQAVKDGAAVASPSKITKEVGRYIGEGLIIGMQQMSGKVDQAGNDLAASSLQTMNEMVEEMLTTLANEDFDISPTITPMVDMTSVNKGAQLVQSMFDQAVDMSSVFQNMDNAAFSFRKPNVTTPEKVSNGNNGIGGNTFTFNQYNTSPKSLAEGEIYRQTKSQFSTFKRMVGAQ